MTGDWSHHHTSTFARNIGNNLVKLDSLNDGETNVFCAS